MKNGIVKFFKIYLIFLLTALVINLTLELIVPTPERAKIVAEHGLEYFLLSHTKVIIIFYLIFSLIGALIYFYNNYKPLTMGILSFVVGFFLEFTLMRPDWVEDIITSSFHPGLISSVVVSAIYWFVPWGVPVYLIKKYFKHAT